jgi:phosphatidylglycerophosphatase A
MNRLATWIATAGPAGYAPVAPGTFGSAVGVGIYFLIATLPLSSQVWVAVILTIIGVWASSIASAHFNRADPSQVVVDEVAGQVVTLVGLGRGWTTLLFGFLVFRALDIIKPWPANRFEKLHGGIGIVADDVMAALYGQVILRVAIALLPGFF